MLGYVCTWFLGLGGVFVYLYMRTCVLDKWGRGGNNSTLIFLVTRSWSQGRQGWQHDLVWPGRWIEYKNLLAISQIGSGWVLLLIICICVWSSSLALSLLLKTYSWLSGRPPLYGNWFYNKADDAKPAVGLFYTALNALVDCKKLCFLFYSAFYALVDSGLQSSG